MSRSALHATAALVAAPVATCATVAGVAPEAALAAPAVPANAPPTFDPATLVKLDQIDVPIVDAGRLGGVLHLTLVVETRSPDTASALAKRMPELRAASLAAAIEFARLRASPFAAVDVERLQHTLTPALRRVDPGIARVLIVRASALRS
ncbi:hypothetical protein [Novosphingobium clariflavum]|uniref:Flagellar protein FliL n=1 Tax=Novosphingobium clariflavum TaxID=2029884 RepID=A0ABV6SB88_9SPHN|nr:hypothetical protein [Novosphingobium clariflavum]